MAKLSPGELRIERERAESRIRGLERAEREYATRVSVTYGHDGEDDSNLAAQMYGQYPPAGEHVADRLAIAAAVLSRAVPAVGDPWLAAAAVRELQRVRAELQRERDALRQLDRELA